MDKKKLVLVLAGIILFFVLIAFVINTVGTYNNSIGGDQKIDLGGVSENCVLWFDGCNYCEVDFEGSLICTKIYCSPEEYEQPNCQLFLEDDFKSNDDYLNKRNFLENYYVGYCPTMTIDAFLFKEKNENVLLIEFNAASEVLGSLKNNDINMAIIGRRAKGFEIENNVTEEIKETGFTLVFNEKVFIQTIDLPKILVHTHHIDFPADYFSENQVIFHNSLEETILKSNLNNQVALIKWEEFEDNMELIVVMDNDRKNKDFRGVFYYKKFN